jgi:hypothetical protein
MVSMAALAMLLEPISGVFPFGDTTTRTGYFPQQLENRDEVCTSSYLDKVLDKREDSYLRRVLRKAGERSLYKTDGMQRRSETTVVRLTQVGPGPTIKIIRADIGGGFAKLKDVYLIHEENRKIEFGGTTQRHLTKNEIHGLRQLLSQSALSEIPHGSCDYGFDGYTWTIEVVRSEGYYFFERWVPQEGPVFEIGDYLETLANGD